MEPTHHRVTVNGIELHYVEAGSGPLVVLVHGFPESWYSWRNQIPALVEAGYRVVAADLRGYGESAKPRAVDDYRLTTVATDIASLIEHLGAPCVLVGHDWGGVVSWLVAMMRPELLRKLVVLNVPHPAPLVREIRNSTKQKLRLAYQLFFRLPFIPEMALPFILPRLLRKAGSFTEEEINEYKKGWSDPATRHAMANYYRAVARTRGEMRQLMRRIDIPTLLIWGKHEPVFIRQTTENFSDHVTRLRIEIVPRAGHFVQTDAPEVVNAFLVEFARS